MCADRSSCKALLASGVKQSGTYTIDPDGPKGAIPSFQVFCDMTTDGGGWTEVTLDIARNKLGGKLVAVDSASRAGIDSSHRPFTQDTSDGHTYHYTFQFPAGYQEFYLNNYFLKAFAPSTRYTSDIYPTNFRQTTWSAGNRSGGTGDVSFGTPDNTGPLTSFARHFTSNFSCSSCTQAWPAGTRIFKFTKSTKAFRIGWGENGPEHEGWYPWWSGTIRIR